MTELVDSSIAQYAVIEARRTEGPPERFVIAYPDEEMKNRCGNSSLDPASSRVASPRVQRLKPTSTLTSARAPFGRKLQETELRNINAEFFPRSSAWEPGST